jgi:NAD(P)-dependent dehydrogenase (short-subunit alcohol dehydrogenase family)
VKRVDGKVVLISGAARGIGASAAMALASEGARVVAGDVRDELGASVVAKVQDLGGAAIYMHLDVSDEHSWQDVMAQTLSLHGRLDVLVNNAGILIGKGIEATTLEEWDRVLAINLTGTFLGTKAAIPALRQSGGGSIVNVSSASGLVGNPLAAAYSASKGGIRLLTKSTALEFAAENIRCNSIHPGPIETDLARDGFGAAGPPASVDDTNRVPMGRFGRPEEVAHLIVFLASDESSYMTGSELVVDGGRTAQ